MTLLERVLKHPLTADLPVDDPRTTVIRRRIVKEKSFLSKLYAEWYLRIIGALPKSDSVLELGSGPGFLSSFLPDAITSEVFFTPEVSIIANASNLPLADKSLDAIVMTDVFHHLANVDRFFSEAVRCLRPQGRIVMIEPWRTPWSEWVYTRFHSEPFLPESGWQIPLKGPLSGANGALPWIVFHRDRSLFEEKFPEWRIRRIEAMMPFTYLLSGGVSMRSLAPGWMYKLCRVLENMLNQERWAMFALIELELVR